MIDSTTTYQKLIRTVFALTFALSLSACQNAGTAASGSEAELESFYGESVVYDAAEDAYLVGDAYITPDFANELTEGLSLQQRFKLTIHPEHRGDITYYIAPSVPDEWKWAHIKAADKFNDLGTGLKFRRVWSCEMTWQLQNDGVNRKRPQGCDTYVKGENSSENFFGKAYYPTQEFPTSGLTRRAPGYMITYNTHYADRSWKRRIKVALHEIGHTVGLAHDVDESGYIIPGTPERDRASIMARGLTSYERNYFSENDIKALKSLYP